MKVSERALINKILGVTGLSCRNNNVVINAKIGLSCRKRPPKML